MRRLRKRVRKEMQHQLVQAEIFSTFSTFLVHQYLVQYHTTKSGSILALERWKNIKGLIYCIFKIWFVCISLFDLLYFQSVFCCWATGDWLVVSRGDNSPPVVPSPHQSSRQCQALIQHRSHHDQDILVDFDSPDILGKYDRGW